MFLNFQYIRIYFYFLLISQFLVRWTYHQWEQRNVFLFLFLALTLDWIFHWFSLQELSHNYSLLPCKCQILLFLLRFAFESYQAIFINVNIRKVHFLSQFETFSESDHWYHSDALQFLKFFHAELRNLRLFLHRSSNY